MLKATGAACLALVITGSSLDTSLPFPELKARSLINDKAHAADQAPDFSQSIREAFPARRSADLSVPGLHVSQPRSAHAGPG